MNTASNLQPMSKSEKFNKDASLRLKLSALLIIIIVGVMSLFSAIRIFYAQQEVEKSLEHNASLVASRVSKSVRPNIWKMAEQASNRQYSSDFTSTILDAELESPAVQAVYVYGNSDFLFMGKYKTSDGKIHDHNVNRPNYTAIGNELLFSHSITQGGLDIGRVDVILSTEQLKTLKMHLIWVELFQVLLVALFCTAFLYFSINRVLLAPMQKLIQLQTSNDKKQEIIEFIHKGITEVTGDNFLDNLVSSACDTLNIDCALIGEISIHNSGMIKIVSAFNRQGIVLPDSFNLPESVAEQVIFNGILAGHVKDIEMADSDPLVNLLKAKYIYGIPLKGLENTIIGLMLILHSSAPAEAEKTLSVLEVFSASAGAELARNRAMRSQHLAEEQLHHTQRMETLGTLAGGIAHDFNNLLLPIGGYAELALEEAKGNPALCNDLNEILKGTKRAGDLVKQIQSFSRSLPAEKEVFSLVTLLENTVKFVRGTTPAMVTLDLKLPEHLPLLNANQIQIDQCIVNLITNAQHAINSKGRILVSAEEFSVSREYAAQLNGIRTGNYIKILVSDNGCGMSEEVVDMIFTPFFTTKEANKGTGLGLATCYSIIQSHRGHIDVYSRPGIGTTFTILLPAYEELGLESSTDSILNYSSLAGLRVLFVDDEKNNIQLARRMLKNLHCSCTAFLSPKEALQEFTHHPNNYDVFITDFAMPEMKGDELITKIKSTRADIHCIAISGLHELDKEDWLKLDVDRILSKPYDVNELAKALLDLST